MLRNTGGYGETYYNFYPTGLSINPKDLCKLHADCKKKQFTLQIFFFEKTLICKLKNKKIIKYLLIVVNPLKITLI